MPNPPEVLDNRYRLEKVVGKGGFAKVYLATHLALDKQFAVKVLNVEMAQDPEFLERFKQEARSIASLEHPKILSVHDYGQSGNSAYLVMPFVDGGTLQERISRSGPLSVQEAGSVLTQMAAALHYAHSRHIVHRDVKPQNMLIQRDNSVVLTDFGIAKLLTDGATNHLTRPMGTLSYMAPEQMDGQVSSQCDIYSLGVVLYQMLTGQLPFKGTTNEVLNGHYSKPVPSLMGHPYLQYLPPFVVQSIDGIISRAMAKKPQDRFWTAYEFAAAYNDIITNLVPKPSNAGTEVSPPTVPIGVGRTLVSPILEVPRKSNKPIRLGAIAGVFLAIAALIIVLVLTQPKHVPGSSTATVNTVTLTPAVAASAAVSTTTLTTDTIPADPIMVGLNDANETFFTKGDLTGGLEKFRKLSLAYPANAKVWRDYGNALHLSGLNAGGVEAAERACQLDAKDPLAALYLMFTYFDTSQSADAEKEAKAAAQLDPDGWIGHGALASFYNLTYKFDQARPETEAMQKIAGSAAQDPYYNWVLSNNLLLQQDYRGAVDAIDRTLSKWPNVPVAIALKATYLLSSPEARDKDSKKNIQDKAVALYQQALKLAPKSGNILTALASYYAFVEPDYTQAENYAQQALNISDAIPGAHNVLGSVLAGRKDYQKAYQQFKRCVEINELAASCYFNWAKTQVTEASTLGNTNGSNADQAKATNQAGLDNALKAYKLLPGKAEYNWLVGYCYYYPKDYKSAITYFQQAINISPSEANYYAWLVKAYLGDGQKDKAKDTYNKGLAINPEDPGIKSLTEYFNQNK